MKKMKSCAAERTNTDRCYLYKRKDVERNVDAKLGGTVLVLFLRSSSFNTISGFLAHIFQRFTTD